MRLTGVGGKDVLGGRFLAHKDAQSIFTYSTLKQRSWCSSASLKLLVASSLREDYNHVAGGLTASLDYLPVV